MKNPNQRFIRVRRYHLVCAAGLLATLLPTVAAETQQAGAQGSTLDLPKTFEGTLKVEQSRPNQTNFPGYGIFSSFQATATFSNLVFGQGKEGPYTLLRGTVAYTGFDITQSVPNGNFGQCEATYHFALAPSEPLFGDLGGFSETGGHWRLQIQLGISTVGAITTSTNCEPDNAGTASVFGAPSSPKISFPVSAEGDFNPKTGTITFNDKSTYRYLGAPFDDQVTGTLEGGLQIYYNKNGKEVNVTDEVSKVVVGQPINLSARFSDGSQPDLSGHGWTGITGATTLRDYVFEDSIGRPIFLDKANLTDAALKFYWVKDSADQGVGFLVQVVGKNKKTGDQESAQTIFDVVGPEVGTFAATTCGVGINRTLTTGGLKPPDLILGYNDTSPGCLDTAGVKWNISVTAPSVVGGKVGMTQTVVASLEHNNTPCTVGKARLDGSTTYADGGSLLDGFHAVTPTGDWTTNKLADSPHVGLRRGGTWSSDDTFADYIMFEPDIPHSIYVAVAQLSVWSFKGSAAASGPTWELGTYQDPPRSLSSTAATEQPKWTGAITGKQLSGC